MPNKRRINLDAYNISRFAYDELKAFCLQYPEKKQKLLDMRNPLKCQQYSDMPHGSGVDDSTAQAALLAAKLSKDTEMIEQTAIEAGAEIYQCIILAVTEDVPWYYLRLLKGLEIGEKAFRTIRRKFFKLLAEKKGMT